jgi:hypothetical protein
MKGMCHLPTAISIGGSEKETSSIPNSDAYSPSVFLAAAILWFGNRGLHQLPQNQVCFYFKRDSLIHCSLSLSLSRSLSIELDWSAYLT